MNTSNADGNAVSVPALPLRLCSLVERDSARFWALQRYIDLPPGEGMAVIYVEVSPSGKLYVGQHCHGVCGLSYSKTRMFRHGKCRALEAAYSKYGTQTFRCFIIEHCRAGTRSDVTPEPDDSNGLEQFYISSEGLDTLVPNGYNLMLGGQGGPLHPESIANMKATNSIPEVRAKKSRSLRATMSTTEYRKRRSDSSKEMWQRPDYREKMDNERELRIADPTYRKKLGEASKRMWKRDEYRVKHGKAMAKSKADPAYLKRQSDASKRMWESEEYRQKHKNAMEEVNRRPEVLEKRAQSIRMAHTREDVKRSHSQGIKKAKTKRMQQVLLPAIRSVFEACWATLKTVNAPEGTVISGRDIGKICKKIRSRFEYVRHSPEFAEWLKERGFKMRMRDPNDDAQKWAELMAMYEF